MQNADTAPTPRFALFIPGLIEPEGLEVRERPEVAPDAGEVLVATEATGVSYAEVQMLRGRYPGQPAFPFVPGYDIVGRVVALGPDVDDALLGKRVATLTGFGAWAERVVLRAEQLVVVPDALDAAEVDALITNGLTAYKMLHRVARVRAGQTVVVLGAGGGVGSLLVQLARLAGVHVIGTCRPSQRSAVEALGAQVVDFTRERVPEDVRALAPAGVDAVFDHVGGAASLRSSFAMLRRGGYLVCYGNASLGRTNGSAWRGFLEFIALKLMWSVTPGRRRSTFFDVWGRGTLGADHMFRPRRFWRELRDDLGALVELLATHQLKPQIARRIPLRDAASALAAHRAGGFVGKIVLEADVATVMR
ncbi:zinc-binding dehydrogenase [Sorangium sp. So ce887]|uniref:zinc-binding dehydrogenase n=1 Tax=Sorangium sp. So ce887 TaxID=3133324 RepID=UPI003F5EF409